MHDLDRSNFDQALDSLSNILNLNKLNHEAKFGYFKALKSHTITSVVHGLDSVIKTYKPRSKDNFPAPSVIIEAITGVVRSTPDNTYQSRTYEQIRESYRKHGILIGEEAREHLEAEIAQRRQESDENREEAMKVLE